MLKNRIILSTLTTFFLSSSCLFGMELPDDRPASPPVAQSAAACEGNRMDQTAVAAPVFLSLADRPADVQHAVDGIFRSISRAPDRWRYNGEQGSYHMCGIDDDRLVLHILHKCRGQKTVRFMDLGSGNEHGWAKKVCHFINAQQDLPDDLRVHLYSLTGGGGAGYGDPSFEKDRCNKSTEKGRCILHEYLNCKIENLPATLQERGIDEPFDLVISSWALRHLVDPLMTFKCAYDRLKPGAFFLADGFYVKINRGGDVCDIAEHSLREQVFLLQDTGSDFLIRSTIRDGCSLNQFIIQKTQEGACQLPLHYDCVQALDEGERRDVYSQCITCFKGPHRELPQKDVEKIYESLAMVGSQRLYQDLQEAELWGRELWRPAYSGDFSSKGEELKPKE